MQLHPGVDTRHATIRPEDPARPNGEKISIVSIGRYERVKNARLAIEAIAALRAHLPPQAFEKIQLVVAGGFDERLAENRETLADLQAQARDLDLEQQVVFLKSVPHKELLALVSRCLCVVHAAAHEHFGYVPIEAMAAGRPVVVADSGGPNETVVEGVTGFVRPPTAQAFAEALARLIVDPEAARNMGRSGTRARARAFAAHAFGLRLERLLEQELGTGDEAGAEQGHDAAPARVYRESIFTTASPLASRCCARRRRCVGRWAALIPISLVTGIVEAGAAAAVFALIKIIGGTPRRSPACRWRQRSRSRCRAPRCHAPNCWYLPV